MRPFIVSLVLLCSFAVRAAVPPADDAARRLTREIYQQLIEINTTESSGSCTAAAQAMAARLKAATADHLEQVNAAEIAACRNWWEAELESVRPEVLCCLGAIAAQAVLGKSFRVTKRRGEVITLPSGIDAIATIHPSAVLRSDDREAALAGLVHDLEIVRDRLAT
jgi:DNA polymerase